MVFWRYPAFCHLISDLFGAGLLALLGELLRPHVCVDTIEEGAIIVDQIRLTYMNNERFRNIFMANPIP